MHGVAAPRCGPFASTSATDMRVLTLAGGTGAAKLIRGLATCMPQRDLTVIGNTGDDTEVWGLRVSPDLDTVMYALAGMLDVERGWGLAGETFNCLAAMATHGADQTLTAVRGPPRDGDVGAGGPGDRGEIEEWAGHRGVRQGTVADTLPDARNGRGCK